MDGSNNAARILVALGAVVLIVAALLHLSAYPRDLGAVNASNLGARLKGSVCALFFLGRMGVDSYRDHHAHQRLQCHIIQGDCFVLRI
jgi:hypothetical protein